MWNWCTNGFICITNHVSFFFFDLTKASFSSKKKEEKGGKKKVPGLHIKKKKRTICDGDGGSVWEFELQAKLVIWCDGQQAIAPKFLPPILVQWV